MGIVCVKLMQYVIVIVHTHRIAEGLLSKSMTTFKSLNLHYKKHVETRLFNALEEVEPGSFKR